MELMNEKAVESFSRGKCPGCNAWQDWSIIGDEYTCKTCMEAFIYKDNQLFVSESKSAYQIEKEQQDASPYFSVLSAIDKDNKQYWLPQFGKFDSSQDYKQWNWPTFFFLAHRYMWKGMWKKGLLIHAIILASIFLINAVDALMTPAWLSYSNIGQDKSPLYLILWLMASLAIKVYFSSNGAKDYYNHIKGFEGDLKKAKTDLITGRILLPIMFIVGSYSYGVIRGFW